MATTAAISQNALNIAVNLQNRITKGQYGTDIYTSVADLCAAVILLAECVNANASTLSATTSPASITIANKYSTVSATAPVYTSP